MRAQAEAIRAGEVSSRELTQHFISRIERLDGDTNAVVTRDFEAALERAGRADDLMAAGAGAGGALFGVPITVKDALMTAGIRSTGGATELADNVPQRDAAVVAALKEQGAVVIGKTNLPRWSADNQTYNEMFGTTNNPWDLTRSPGGSSGGAAVSVAMGFTGFELGTDIGGSIRFPSNFVGVWGHKPSWGLVPTTGYLDHQGGGETEADINVFGPLARSVGDLELLLGLLARREPPGVPQLGVSVSGGVGGDVGGGRAGGGGATGDGRLRVAAWLDDEFCRVDSQVLAVLEPAVDALETSGVEVDRQARPEIDPREAWELGLRLVRAAMSLAGKGEGPSHKEWLANDIHRSQIRQRWAEFFRGFDAVIMPVAMRAAFKHDQDRPFGERQVLVNGEQRPYLEMTCWTILTGMAYLPATVPPLGLTNEDLPVGCQVVGAYGADRTALEVARLLAEAAGAGFTPPPLALS